MDIQYIESTDADQIYNIFMNFFSDMEFPDFYRRFHCSFKVITNDLDNRIIAVGGIRPLAETVVLTNKDFSVRDRMQALLKIFNGVKYAAEKLDYEQIHAFAYDEEYIKHLINRIGFKYIPENKVLSLDLKHGQEKRSSSAT